MARYKRYFPVSHDINGDPEVDELCKRFQLGGLRLWLEILAITDRNQNEIKLNRYAVAKLSQRASQRLASTFGAINWMIRKGWLIPNKELTNDSETVYGAAKYAEYHRTKEPNGNENKKIGDKFGTNSGEIRVPPSFLPSVRKNKTRTSLRSVPKSSLRSGEKSQEKSAVPESQAAPDKVDKPAQSESVKDGNELVADYAPQTFDDLWNMWPRKEGYPEAKKKWNEKRPTKEDVEKIFHDVPIWKKMVWCHYSSVIRVRKLANWIEDENWKKDDPPRRIVC